jgi:mannose-1-phosphate guanylyltransferase
MILAGGLSTRLYPLTKKVPKPLVPVAGVPNAVHVIRYLVSHGYTEIAINIHYLADMIVAALGDGSAYGARLEYLHERELLGSAGAVKQMEAFLGSGTFVVIGCDDVTDLPLNRAVEFHTANDALATIGLVERDEVDQYGVVVTDDSGRITEFQEKPPKGTEKSKRVNTGVYVFAPQIFEHIPPGTFYDFGKNVFPSLQQADAAFYGYDARGAQWYDIGTPAEYRAATNAVLSGQLRIAGFPVDGDVQIGKSARISPDARIVGPSVIGERVDVGKGARIERSIVWEGARIGENAVLRDSIVGMDYDMAAGSVLEDAIVATE